MLNRFQYQHSISTKLIIFGTYESPNYSNEYKFYAKLYTNIYWNCHCAIFCSYFNGAILQRTCLWQINFILYWHSIQSILILWSFPWLCDSVLYRLGLTSYRYRNHKYTFCLRINITLLIRALLATHKI